MNIKAHIRELEARLEKKAGHDLWTCFVKAPNFHEAKKQAEKKLDYALMHDDDLRHQHGLTLAKYPDKTFKTLNEAQDYAYNHVRDYDSKAFDVEEPKGYFFAIDYHF